MAGSQNTKKWTYGLFKCLDNKKMWARTFFMPCLDFGKIAKSMGETCTGYGLAYSVPVLNCMLHARLRETVREKRHIAGSFPKDAIVVACCGSCSLMQELREVKLMNQNQNQNQKKSQASVGFSTSVREHEPAVESPHVRAPGSLDEDEEPYIHADDAPEDNAMARY